MRECLCASPVTTEPERKSDTVRRLVLSGDYKAALRIAKGFRLGIPRDDIGAMTRAYECMQHPGFFAAIGIDPDSAIDKGIRVLKTRYGVQGGVDDEI